MTRTYTCLCLVVVSPQIHSESILGLKMWLWNCKFHLHLVSIWKSEVSTQTNVNLIQKTARETTNSWPKEILNTQAFIMCLLAYKLCAKNFSTRRGIQIQESNCSHAVHQCFVYFEKFVLSVSEMNTWEQKKCLKNLRCALFIKNSGTFVSTKQVQKDFEIG